MEQQITIDQALNALFQKVNELEMRLNAANTTINVLARSLLQKETLTKEEINEALATFHEYQNVFANGKLDKKIFEQMIEPTVDFATEDSETLKKKAQELLDDMRAKESNISIAEPQFINKLEQQPKKEKILF